MSTYTFGPAELNARVERDLETIVARIEAAFSPVGVILGGSFGRGEGCGRLHEGLWRPQNDYDLWVVLDQQPDDTARELGIAIAREIGIHAVDIAFTTPRALRSMRPSQSAYDLRKGARTLHGASDLLELIPAFERDLIPIDDALTLLFNRAAGLIGHFSGDDFQSSGALPPNAVQEVQLYHAWTACGDAVLIARGAYDHRFSVKVDSAPRALVDERVLSAPEADIVRAAYDARLGRRGCTFATRSDAYTAAAQALGSTLRWVLGRVIPGRRELGSLLSMWERRGRTATALMHAAAASFRARSTAHLLLAGRRERVQATCARLVLEARVAADMDPLWDVRRSAAYGEWNALFH